MPHWQSHMLSADTTATVGNFYCEHDLRRTGRALPVRCKLPPPRRLPHAAWVADVFNLRLHHKWIIMVIYARRRGTV